MPVSAAIEEVLSKRAIEYGVSEVHPNTDFNSVTGATRTSLLKDSLGKVQVIFCADSILDINALCRLTKRELSAAPPEDSDSLCTKLQLEQLPSIPQVIGYDLVIDERLLGFSSITMNPGDAAHMVSMDVAQFKTLAGEEAEYGTIAIQENELDAGNLDDADDVEQISKAVATFTQIRIKSRLEDTLEFPPLPDTAQRIIKLRVDPDADIKDLTDIVETDPALAAQVVSWAASPYYAAPGKIKSIHDAIVRVLGFDLVMNLSLGLALGKTLKMPTDCPRGFTPYWEQAVYAATAAEALVGAIPPKHRPTMGMAYLSGLLHNFGYLILAEVFPPQFASLCRYQEANPLSNHCHLERHLLGVTRDQLGGWLMRLWNMPEEVCVALRYQNEPGYQDHDSPYANLLYIAMRLLRKRGIGDAALTPIPDELYERLHLDPEKAEEAIDTLLESAAELNMMASNLAA